MRDTIFISHSNPNDNDFARWLALKLINLGYKVWADVLKLKGGNYTWGIIENEIRNNTIKFLFITSRNSNQAEGCINELSVADSVKRINKDNQKFIDFIIPLKTDDLPFSEMNIFINKLFAIKFDKSWAKGLKELLDKFNEDNIQQVSGYDSEFVSNWWNNIFISDKKPIQSIDEYYSNWFPIVQYPEYLNLHKFGKYLNKKRNVDEFKFPAWTHSDYLITFAYCYDFIEELPKSEYYNPHDTITIKTDDILNENFRSNIIQPREAKNILTSLLKLAWEKKMQAKGLLEYEQANKKKCFTLKDNFNETNRVGRIKLVGKLKEKTWHFGMSIFPKYYPFFGIGIQSHIIFSNDGVNFIENTRIQHLARRRLGRNWWNFQWREKLLCMMKYLSDDEVSINLVVGSEENISINNTSTSFLSNISYNEPEKDLEIDSNNNDSEDDSDENIDDEEVTDDTIDSNDLGDEDL